MTLLAFLSWKLSSWRVSSVLSTPICYLLLRIERMAKIILDLCGGSGSWSKPYKDAGYDVRLVTLPEHDARTYEPPVGVYGVLAAPPCTEFSYVKNEKLPRDIEGALEVVRACLRIITLCEPEFHALENPIGHLVSFLGKPQFTFQPWEFGDPWTKRTGIWGHFNHPKKYYAKFQDVVS